MTGAKPSKSERKRQILALQELGERLIALSDSALRDLRLDEKLEKAVRDAGAMTSRGALRRQKQLIGKLMRNVDPEPIRQALARLSAEDLRAKRRFARAERWRDKLVRDGDTALAEFESESRCEDDELRQLLRDLAVTYDERHEKALRKQLFRRVHTILVAATEDG